jgi:hypothetical protein
MTEKTYPDVVDECAQTRVDLDTILHPTFSALKKAFVVLFGDHGWSKSDFKLLADMIYYQGGYPTPDSPAKEFALASKVGKILLMQDFIGRNDFRKYLEDQGITITINDNLMDGPFLASLSPEDEKEFTEALKEGGVDETIDHKSDMLGILLTRAHALQAEICQDADTIKIDAAELVETQFKIKKGNFVKAVGLAAVKMRRGEGPMLEKIETLHDNQENLNDALKPLEKTGS